MSSNAFRLTSLEMKEDELQHSVCNLLDRLLLPPAVWFAMPVGHVQLTPAQAARMSRIGVKRGLPDLMIVHGGRVHGIELKRRGGKLSATKLVRTPRGALRELVGQDQMFPRLMRAGMRLAVCHSVDEVMDALVEFGLPLLSRSIAA